MTFKCEKSEKQKEILFSSTNSDQLKKVDVFMNNKDFTLIALKADNSRVKITEKVIEEAQRGDNIGSGVKAYSFQVLGLSYYNFHNHQCYDIDRKYSMKSFVETAYTPSASDNNSEFKFDVAVMAQEGPTGTMCAVYAIFAVPSDDNKYSI